MTTSRGPASRRIARRHAMGVVAIARWARVRMGLLIGGAPLAVAVCGLVVSPAIAAPVPNAGAYVTNGSLHAVAVDGAGRIYLGGSFTQVGPRTGHGLKLTATSDQ